MFGRLYCEHCDKHYETFLEDIKLMKKSNPEEITFANNTYHYKGKKCFFTEVKKLKNSVSKNFN